MLLPAQTLKNGDNDVAIAFAQKGGFEFVISYFSVFPNSVSSILLLAGSRCHCQPGKEATPVGSRENQKLRWPAWVVARLFSVAFEGFAAGVRSDAARGESRGKVFGDLHMPRPLLCAAAVALDLLETAARDPHMRQTGFITSASQPLSAGAQMTGLGCPPAASAHVLEEQVSSLLSGLVDEVVKGFECTPSSSEEDFKNFQDSSPSFASSMASSASIGSMASDLSAWGGITKCSDDSNASSQQPFDSPLTKLLDLVQTPVRTGGLPSIALLKVMG